MKHNPIIETCQEKKEDHQTPNYLSFFDNIWIGRQLADLIAKKANEYALCQGVDSFNKPFSKDYWF